MIEITEDINWEEEYQKCLKSPWYYIKNYSNMGSLLTHSEKEFNQMFDLLKNHHNINLKRRRLKK